MLEIIYPLSVSRQAVYFFCRDGAMPEIICPYREQSFIIMFAKMFAVCYIERNSGRYLLYGEKYDV